MTYILVRIERNCRNKFKWIILKSINILSNFYIIFEVYIKFYTLWNKLSASCLITSEVILSEDGGSLNVQ